jgi:hypothetical protein
MATKIESTVGSAAADLAKAGLAGNKRVMMIVLDAEDEAKLADLRAAIIAADASGDYVDGDEAFEQVRRELEKKFPTRP